MPKGLVDLIRPEGCECVTDGHKIPSYFIGQQQCSCTCDHIDYKFKVVLKLKPFITEGNFIILC